MNSFQRLIRLPLRLVPQDTVLRILSGPLAGRRWLSTSSTHGCWLGTYERELQTLLVRYVRPGDTVLDIGANVGFFTLLLSKLVGPSGHVIAFEPLPRNVLILKRHLELNAVTNVTVVTSALSDRNGPGFFSDGESHAMGSLSDTGIPITMVTLDSFLRDSTIQAPVVLKIDVEGAESQVLAGAIHLLQQTRPRIFLSTHGWQQNDTCKAFLSNLGYSVLLRRDGSTDGQYELIATASVAEC